MNFIQTIARTATFGVLLSAGLAAPTISAQEVEAAAKPGRFTIGAEVGTTGIGPVLQYVASERVVLALSFGYFDFDARNLKTGRARYDADLRASNLAATVDWHPWAGRFHVTGGAVVYDHRFDVTARPRNGSVYQVGNNDYGNSQITSITGRVDTNTKVAPYLGVGWTWTFGRSGYSLTTNFGFMFTQDGDARLTATGPMATDATFLRDLRIEEDDINDGRDIFPVAKVGFAYRF